MAYNKLRNFAKENSMAKLYLDEGMIFEAWIVYIRENPKDAEDIVNDIDQEIYCKRCPLSDGEKNSLQYEAMDLLRQRNFEDENLIAI